MEEGKKRENDVINFEFSTFQIDYRRLNVLLEEITKSNYKNISYS